MSTKEMVLQLIENVPEYKLGYVLAYLQGMTADDAAEDAFCEQLCRDYENDPDKGQFVSIDEAAKSCGVNLDVL